MGLVHSQAHYFFVIVSGTKTSDIKVIKQPRGNGQWEIKSGPEGGFGSLFRQPDSIHKYFASLASRALLVFLCNTVITWSNRCNTV